MVLWAGCLPLCESLGARLEGWMLVLAEPFSLPCAWTMKCGANYGVSLSRPEDNAHIAGKPRVDQHARSLYQLS